MLSKSQAKSVIKLMGKPDFVNTRKGYRTWKWYCEAAPTLKRLDKAGILIHDYHSRIEAPEVARWTPESVTVKVPVDYSLRDFKSPDVKYHRHINVNRRDIDIDDLRKNIMAKVRKMSDRQIRRLAEDIL